MLRPGLKIALAMPRVLCDKESTETKQTRNQKMFKFKATTFNGLVITGKGATIEQAKQDAKEQAKKLGTALKKRIG